MKLVEGVAHVDDLEEFLAAVDRITAETGAIVQVFDARYVVSREQLERAVELAERARDRGEEIARDPAVEILLYAAGRRQIDRALEMGIEEGETPAVAVVVGNDGDESAAAAALGSLFADADTLGEYDETRVREFFDVSTAELAAVDGGLADVVLERVALLDVEK
ncbi:KEOPS complex subunit Cgi121 [Halalkaliarchaeum sp. AArc-GB]|uniref:KEOPS complex subunit Cgi121 n=1 Tax=unclassified Halalkaliarchaeum TaxID=2678344 RepID=UPI00217CFC45|nr:MULTISPECIES: KEOPS complex subunit Cgi121 [unclassified Halalkaliarchaeum]MDR5673719.1 KEOPS complex subunit Cgi121 [Halalkaliarchaeum sp. AArc-GB]